MEKVILNIYHFFLCACSVLFFCQLPYGYRRRPGIEHTPEQPCCITAVSESPGLALFCCLGVALDGACLKLDLAVFYVGCHGRERLAGYQGKRS